ncbi:MAG: Flp family type IVb pilin [Caulobacteraceae bacterium]|nr:Flp family type IVb pilin [Caulobacteraceae bacterium]
MEKVNELAARAFLAIYNDRKGVTAVEYGLIAGLIAVAIIGAISLVGTDLGLLFNKVASNLANA